MTTIIDYVRKATTPLRTDLTPADALTLAALSYADFHALVGPRSARGCLLSEIAQASSILALYDHTMVTKHNRALLRSGASSASCLGFGRFGSPKTAERPLRVSFSRLGSACTIAPQCAR